MKFSWLLCFFTLTSCFQGSKLELKKLTVTGSSTIAPVISEIVQEFEKDFPEIRVDVQTGGSSRGVTDARNRTSDIGMVSRALKSNEKDLANYVIAQDGVAVIVNKSVPLKNITTEQLVSIYKKNIVNWSELGFQDQAITVIHKAQGRSTGEIFLEFVKLQDSDIKADIIIGDNEQGIKNAASIPGSIAYVSIGAAETAIHNGQNIHLVDLNSIASTTENVANGSFPMKRELNLVIPKDAVVSEETQKFLDYMKNQKSIRIVKALDFVPIKL